MSAGSPQNDDVTGAALKALATYFCTDANGIFVEVAEKASRLFGAAAEELRGTDVRDFFADRQGMPAVAPVAKSEVQFRSKSGFPFWLELTICELPAVSGGGAAFLWTGFDITERKTTEQFLAESQLFSKALMQTAPVGLFVTSPQGSCNYVNACWAAQSGLSGGKAKGNGWQSRLHPEDKERVVQLWEKFVRGEDQFANAVFRYARSDGKEISVQSTAVPLYGIDQGVAGYLRIEQDITESLKNEETIRAQQAQIASSAKLSSLGEMAGGIAHEINTPLAVIRLRMDQLEETLTDPEVDRELARDSIKSILTTIDKIGKIVSGLRKFARDGSRDAAETANLRTVIAETFSLCKERFLSRSIPLDFAVQGADASASVDIECRSTEISQVLLNLLNNAFDAIETLPEKWVKVDLIVGSEHVDICVTDSGAGIPREVQAKIMQPFFTTKEIGKGTGLGLSISRGIVLGHNGDLFVDNTSANTRIVIRLPKRQPEARTQAPSETTKAA